MRNKHFLARIRLLALFLIFSIVTSGAFAFQSKNPRQANHPISIKTALKAIDYSHEKSVSINTAFCETLRRAIISQIAFLDY